MPMLPFLPWATATEQMVFGRFHILPAGEALVSAIPPMHRDALPPILKAYARPRPVDQHRTPLIRREDAGFTDDLSPEQVTDYFAFRTRLTFAVLAAREFFTHRYANGDNTTLIIQGFSPERAGGALLEYRRRDGSTTIIVPPGNLSVPRPHHVGWCELPRDVDLALLETLEVLATRQEPWWERTTEAIRLFNGANTDAPSVDMHTELIDVVSAFSRIADSWDTKGTVGRFIEILPAPAGAAPPKEGPKLQHPRVEQALKKGRAVRELWLEDAYILRSQFGHGRIQAPGYSSIWTEREHLLLAAIAFPLYVKAVLAREGLYQWTEDDTMMNRAFDDLAVLEPFAKSEEDSVPWRETIMRAQIDALAARFEREFLQEHGTDASPS